MKYLWLVFVVAVADASIRWLPAVTSEEPSGMPAGQMIMTVMVISFLAAHAAVCWHFHKRRHVADFYKQAIAEAGSSTTDYYTVGLDDEPIEHTWHYMVRRQAGDIGVKADQFLRLSAPSLMQMLLPYLCLFALRHDHHVFLDLLYLRPRHGNVYEIIACKTRQQNFLEERQKQEGLNSVQFVRRIKPSDGDETKIFVKPRFGAFGEDCCVMASQAAFQMSPKRARHMVFEELLKNHPVIENVVGEQAPLCTLRIWTSRWIPNRPSMQAAFLVARSGYISNCKKNECCQVDLKTQTTAVKSSEATFVLPFFREALFTANWVHDQFPEVPFLGTDIALTPTGAVLLETNLLCSYSIYSKQVGLAYGLDDVEAFLAYQAADEKVANL